MLFGRYWLAVPVLAIAGSLARKKIVPPGPGTLPTHTPLFVVLLIGVVILVGALTFVPALALGPDRRAPHPRSRRSEVDDPWLARVKARSLFDPPIVRQAIVDSFRKLTPRRQVRNPVMFVVYVGSILTTLLWIQALVGKGEAPAWFIFWVSVWLWFTVLFANFAEAMAEGRGKAQAASLRKARRDLQAKRLPRPERGARFETVSASTLRKGDVVLVEAGDFIPADGEVIEGVASVNESAITGESAPVIRESGGDRSSVTGGTQVLSDWLIVEVTANPGEAFLDRMIALVEGAKRQKTPNEIALDILLAALTIIFLLATATLLPFSLYSVAGGRPGHARSRSRCWWRCSSA